MKDPKTTIIGVCAAVVALLTLVIDGVSGKPIDLSTVTLTVTNLLTAFGLYKAADSTK